MKLQRTTLVLLTTAILLGGGVYFSEIQRAQNQETTKTTKEPIFSFKEDQIQSVTIYTDKETLEFERVKGQTSNWRMKQPNDAPASDAAVAFLLDLLAEGKSDRSFYVSTNQRQEYGFDVPFATVKVQLNNKATHRLILGKPDFNRTFIYAQVDPPPQTPDQFKVLLVPIDFEYAVNRPLSEWQSQPEKGASPTPSPTATSVQPSPTSSTAKPSPSPTQAKPPTTSSSPKPSPSPTQAKPSTTSSTAKPSPSPTQAKPPTTSSSPKPSPSPTQAKPSTTSSTAKPSPSPTQAKPSTTSSSPKPSPSPTQAKPSTTSSTAKPSPSPTQAKPSTTSSTAKPSPSPTQAKPPATSSSPKPSPTEKKE